MYFGKILIVAFVVALVTSAITSLYQAQFVTPIILAAEVYEVPDMVASDAAEPWGPEDGSERSVYTLSANFLVSFSFATLLLCAMVAKGNVRPVQGLLWAAAGYLCFFVAPGLGLAPEIPGMEAAQLEARQTWWWFTVALSVAGLWLLAFEGLKLKVAGLFLLLLPHIVGAPHAEQHGFANPDPEAVTALTGLWHDFIIQTSISNALLWILIGMISAYLAAKYIESNH